MASAPQSAPRNRGRGIAEHGPYRRCPRSMIAFSHRAPAIEPASFYFLPQCQTPRPAIGSPSFDEPGPLAFLVPTRAGGIGRGMTKVRELPRHRIHAESGLRRRVVFGRGEFFGAIRTAFAGKKDPSAFPKGFRRRHGGKYVRHQSLCAPRRAHSVPSHRPRGPMARPTRGFPAHRRGTSLPARGLC